MNFFPFDTQKCIMVLTPTEELGDFVKLLVDDHTNLGPTELTQYFIRDTRMFEKTLSTMENAIVMEVVLGRRLLGNFLTIFFPTILLNVIGHSTNFFKSFFFEAVVTVNLTVLLVLVTMFISVSNSLPKTSYVKMVDIWLIFNLVLPFVEVLIHTYKDYLRDDEREINHHGTTLNVGGDDKEKGESSPVMPLNNWISDDEGDGNEAVKALKLNMISRLENEQVDALREYYGKVKSSHENRIAQLEYMSNFIIPFLAILFISFYWIIGLLMYYNPEMFDSFLNYDLVTL